MKKGEVKKKTEIKDKADILIKRLQLENHFSNSIYKKIIFVLILVLKCMQFDIGITLISYCRKFIWFKVLLNESLNRLMFKW